MSPQNQSRRRVGAVLALVAALLVGYGSQSTRWFTSESSESAFEVGLISARMCVADADAVQRCRSVPLAELESGTISRIALAVFVAGMFAAFLLLAAAARALSRSSRLAWLPRVALASGVFSIAIGVVFLWSAPWTDSMGPGFAAIVYFIGAALAGATAAVPLGGLKATAETLG